MLARAVALVREDSAHSLKDGRIGVSSSKKSKADPCVINSRSIKLSRAWEQRMFPERQTATNFYALGNIKKQNTTGRMTQNRNHQARPWCRAHLAGEGYSLLMWANLSIEEETGPTSEANPEPKPGKLKKECRQLH